MTVTASTATPADGPDLAQPEASTTRASARRQHTQHHVPPALGVSGPMHLAYPALAALGSDGVAERCPSLARDVAVQKGVVNRFRHAALAV